MKPYFETETGKLYCGDVVDVLQKLPEKSVNMCITSPPYWQLRNYGIEGQLGLEPTFEEYINKLCNIFDGVKRVLRDDGTCWVNIGDTYSGSGNGSNDYRNQDTKNYRKDEKLYKGQKSGSTNLPDKSLTMIPFRFAIEMVNRGWILRNTIIWHKPNCMPSSVKDRFTVDFEYLFFFSKKKKYYFEQQFEPVKEKSLERAKYGWETERPSAKGAQGKHEKMGKRFENPKGRNKRTVWKITTKPFSKAHFAVYPEQLIKTPIKAGCPKEICKKCGKPKILDIEKEYVGSSTKRGGHKVGGNKSNIGNVYNIPHKKAKTHIKGYQPTCNCKAEFEPGTVLDIFMGSGTTGLVAEKLHRKWIGIDLNKEYCEIAKQRIKQEADQEKLF